MKYKVIKSIDIEKTMRDDFPGWYVHTIQWDGDTATVLIEIEKDYDYCSTHYPVAQPKITGLNT